MGKYIVHMCKNNVFLHTFPSCSCNAHCAHLVYTRLRFVCNVVSTDTEKKRDFSFLQKAKRNEAHIERSNTHYYSQIDIGYKSRSEIVVPFEIGVNRAAVWNYVKSQYE